MYSGRHYQYRKTRYMCIRPHIHIYICIRRAGETDGQTEGRRKKPNSCMHGLNNRIRETRSFSTSSPRNRLREQERVKQGQEGWSSCRPGTAWLPAGTGSAHAHRFNVLGLVVQQLAQFHGCLLPFETRDPVSRSIRLGFQLLPAAGPLPLSASRPLIDCSTFH